MSPRTPQKKRKPAPERKRSANGNTHGGARKGAGRKSRDEELGYLNERLAFADELPRLGRNCTESDVLDYIDRLDDGFLNGRLSRPDMETLQDSANLRLRAIRSGRADREMEELRQMVKEGRARQAAGRAHGSLDRQHLADHEPESAPADEDGGAPTLGSGSEPRADVGAAPDLAQGHTER